MYFVYNNLVRSYREKTHEELRNPRREHPTSSFPFPPSPLPIPSHPRSYPLRNPFSKVGVKSGRREQELREKGDYERLSARKKREREREESVGERAGEVAAIQFGRTPDSVFCSDPLHPRAARVLLLLLFTVEEQRRERTRERERGTREPRAGRGQRAFLFGVTTRM